MSFHPAVFFWPKQQKALGRMGLEKPAVRCDDATIILRRLSFFNLPLFLRHTGLIAILQPSATDKSRKDLPARATDKSRKYLVLIRELRQQRETVKPNGCAGKTVVLILLERMKTKSQAQRLKQKARAIRRIVMRLLTS